MEIHAINSAFNFFDTTGLLRGRTSSHYKQPVPLIPKQILFQK